MYYSHFDGNKERHDDVRGNNAFFVEIMSTLKAIKSHVERSYDKQNITVTVISYEIIKLAESLFDKFHMK